MRKKGLGRRKDRTQMKAKKALPQVKRHEYSGQNPDSPSRRARAMDRNACSKGCRNSGKLRKTRYDKSDESLERII